MGILGWETGSSFHVFYTIGENWRGLLSVFTWRILPKIFYVVMCNSSFYLFWLLFMWVCIVWNLLSFLTSSLVGFFAGVEGGWAICRVIYDFNVG